MHADPMNLDSVLSAADANLKFDSPLSIDSSTPTPPLNELVEALDSLLGTDSSPPLNELVEFDGESGRRRLGSCDSVTISGCSNLHSSRMGTYYLQSSTCEGYPYYRKGGEYLYYYSGASDWYIGPYGCGSTQVGVRAVTAASTPSGSSNWQCTYNGNWYSFGSGGGATCSCDAGSYRSGSSCYACAAGKYQPQSSRTSCDSCPSGKTSPDGSDSSSDCTTSSSGNNGNQVTLNTKHSRPRNFYTLS